MKGYYSTAQQVVTQVHEHATTLNALCRCQRRLYLLEAAASAVAAAAAETLPQKIGMEKHRTTRENHDVRPRSYVRQDIRTHARTLPATTKYADILIYCIVIVSMLLRTCAGQCLYPFELSVSTWPLRSFIIPCYHQIDVRRHGRHI